MNLIKPKTQTEAQTETATDTESQTQRGLQSAVGNKRNGKF